MVAVVVTTVLEEMLCLTLVQEAREGTQMLVDQEQAVAE
jgi:hypothetical protein